MSVPDSLPQRIFLLAYDPARRRIRMGTNLGAMVRAAALAELFIAGHLTDERGRAVPAVERSTTDPVLDIVRTEIAGARARKWQHWVGRRQRNTVAVVRRQLSDGGWVRLESRRLLGLFPTTEVTLRDPRVRKELLGRVTAALKNPAGRTDAADAALVAIVAAGELNLVLDRMTRRANKRRIQELTELSGPIGPALHRAIQAERAAAG